MDIAIIGAGQVGSALARGWTLAGHFVTLGVRDAGKPGVLALSDATGARIASPADAAAGAVVTVLAVPWPAIEATAASLGDMAGRIVVDATNPLGRTDGGLGLVLGHTDSGGETVARLLPGARVVKALNTVGAEIMETAHAFPQRPAMGLAGDDAAARTTVSGLVADLGFEPLDAGPLRAARLLEPLAMVWIHLALTRGMGRDWSLAVTRRTP